MSKTTWHIIINRQTCRSGWNRWKSFLIEHQISFLEYHTFSLEQLHETISSAFKEGARHYLFVGGDGTIHQTGNALMQVAGNQSSDLTIGVLPCGTGNDWVRVLGTAKEVLAKNILEENTVPLHLVKIEWPDGKTRYAFNMVGGALDAAVVYNLRRASFRIPSFILYPFGLIKTLLKPHEWEGTIKSDTVSYSGKILTLQAGFGKYCGGGMYVLPHAKNDSPGLLIMKPKPLLKLLFQFPSIYNGKLIHHKEAITGHFSEISIDHIKTPIPIESDGEFLGYSPVKLTTVFGAMRRIL